MMNLSPTESERLTIFAAAEFARRHLREGVPLSHPEAVAYITDESMLMARSGMPYDAIREKASNLLQPSQVEPGVAAMIPFIMMELSMEEGTKLLTVFDPIPRRHGDLVPGEITPRAEEMVGATVPTPEEREVEVVNEGDRDIQVRSMTHFFEVNRALRFDRITAYGMRLAIPAGSGVRFEPGITKWVPLTPISGGRVMLGHANLVSGQLDDPEVRARALREAEARGYLQGSE